MEKFFIIKFLTFFGSPPIFCRYPLSISCNKRFLFKRSLKKKRERERKREREKERERERKREKERERERKREKDKETEIQKET